MKRLEPSSKFTADEKFRSGMKKNRDGSSRPNADPLGSNLNLGSIWVKFKFGGEFFNENPKSFSLKADNFT